MAILSYIFPGYFNFTSLLFGDIISTDVYDALTLSLILAIVIIFFISFYRKLILIILSKDLAHSRGVKVKMLEFLFLSILSFAVLATIKIVGVLLVTSIILVPAMVASLISSSPLKMIVIAIFIAQLMNLCGILLSFYADMPLAPIIIVCGGLLYALCFTLSKLLQRK